MTKHQKRSHRSYYPNKAVATAHFSKVPDIHKKQFAAASGINLGILDMLKKLFRRKTA